MLTTFLDRLYHQAMDLFRSPLFVYVAGENPYDRGTKYMCVVDPLLHVGDFLISLGARRPGEVVAHRRARYAKPKSKCVSLKIAEIIVCYRLGEVVGSGLGAFKAKLGAVIEEIFKCILRLVSSQQTP